MNCEICGQNPAIKMWYLEPKGPNANYIMVCRNCHQDLVMIRRWRRHDR